ncbi:heterokaryon incompatibility protein-domain-containing protein [Xylariomycetidae sp. FL0641]|nr:heterokaryon incompatibility protein-domain-containing protein [Xylariomycetidae sp. FL0641]
MELATSHRFYRPLGPDVPEIRVVELCGGELDDPVVCRLHHTQLGTACMTTYEALSYCWGDPLDTTRIELEGNAFAVTKNLHCGLRHIRLPGRSRYLWIDSICIHQADIDERNEQVKKMKEIYKSASHVLIWLGGYSPESPGHVAKLFRHVTTLATAGQDPGAVQALIRKLGYDELWRLHSDLASFLEGKKWFTRMWIIQEVSVRKVVSYRQSSKSPTLICGLSQLPFVYLTVAYSTWSAMPPSASPLRLPLFNAPIRDLIMIWTDHQSITSSGSRSTRVAGQLAYFLTCTSSNFHASNYHDIIYAVLGLVDWGNEGLPAVLQPNYRANFEEVYTEYTVWMLDNTATMDILLSNSGRTNTLPSWVPDWTHRSPSAIGYSNYAEPDAFLQISDDRRAIRVDCAVLTSIAAVMPALFGCQICPASMELLGDFMYECEMTIVPTVAHLYPSVDKLKRTLLKFLLTADSHNPMLEAAEWHINFSEVFATLPAQLSYFQDCVAPFG